MPLSQKKKKELCYVDLYKSGVFKGKNLGLY